MKKEVRFVNFCKIDFKMKKMIPKYYEKTMSMTVF